MPRRSPIRSRRNRAYDHEKAGFEFGNALALDGDGGLALVADEPQDAVVLYQRVGAEWQQMNVLSDNKSSEASEYGIAVAMSGSGNEALVSAPGGETVYSYFESGDAWHEGGTFKYFAYDGQHNVSVAISREGTTAISGEYLSGISPGVDPQRDRMGTAGRTAPNRKVRLRRNSAPTCRCRQPDRRR